MHLQVILFLPHKFKTTTILDLFHIAKGFCGVVKVESLCDVMEQAGDVKFPLELL